MAKKKILLVDDNRNIITLLSNRLRLNNYEVVTANDGEEGLQKALKETPDLIITDIIMPKMDGYSFIKHIRANQSINHIPIIALTSKDRIKELLQTQGVKGYVVKPCKAEDLLEVVRKCLNEQETKTEKNG